MKKSLSELIQMNTQWEGPVSLHILPPIFHNEYGMKFGTGGVK